MKTPKLSSNILIVILVLGVVAALLGPMVCQSVVEGFDQNQVVDRVSIAEGRGIAEPSTESPAGPVAYCTKDPNNPAGFWFGKTTNQPGWGSGDSCRTPSGGLTNWGVGSCVGGGSMADCLAACKSAGLDCSPQGAVPTPPAPPAQNKAPTATPTTSKGYDPELAQRELARARGVLPRDDSNVTTDPLALDEGRRSARGPPERCFDGPPSDVFGNCKPLCKAQSLVDSDGMVRQLSDIMECPEKDRSNTHMLCPSYDECTAGPWYKTLIPKSDRSSPTPADSGTKPSGPGQGPIDIPGRGHDDSWSGDSTYPSRSHFHGGTHHHHYHYDGGEHRRWQREVAPASPHLPTSVHGQQSLASQMSSVSPDGGSRCSQSVTGAFSDCGPAAANIPCYELFNN